MPIIVQTKNNQFVTDLINCQLKFLWLEISNVGHYNGCINNEINMYLLKYEENKKLKDMSSYENNKVQ